MSSRRSGGSVQPLKEIEAAVIGDCVPVESIEVSQYDDSDVDLETVYCTWLQVLVSFPDPSPLCISLLWALIDRGEGSGNETNRVLTCRHVV